VTDLVTPQTYNLIFLDLDGVVFIGGQAAPNPDCVARLNAITAAVQARIVLTSNRRYGRSQATLKRQLVGWGILAHLHDSLPEIGSGDPEALAQAPARSVEIKQWLQQHALEVRRFVVIDDDQETTWSLSRNSIRTDPHQGLQPSQVKQAIQLFVKPLDQDYLDYWRELLRFGR